MAGVVALCKEIGRVNVENSGGGVIPGDDGFEILVFQGDSLDPATYTVDDGESCPHTPGHRAELLAVASVALSDDLVKVRRPLDGVGSGKLGQPSLGNLKILPAVDNIEQTVFQFIGVVSHHTEQIDEVPVFVVENLSHGAFLIEQHRAPAPEHLHVDHVAKSRREPLEDGGTQCLLSTHPGDNGLDRSFLLFFSFFLLGLSSHSHGGHFRLVRQNPEVAAPPASRGAARSTRSKVSEGSWVVAVCTKPKTADALPAFPGNGSKRSARKRDRRPGAAWSLQREITSTRVPGGYCSFMLSTSFL